MKKNNLWNEIFHSKILKKQKQEYEKSKALVGFGPQTLQFVDMAKSLKDLLATHKIAWKNGYRNENLSPCYYGIFRTQNIESMKPEEVFLGNVKGLWTFNILEWEAKKEEDKEAYDIIMQQYQSLLKSNILSMIYTARRFIYEYEETNKKG